MIFSVLLCLQSRAQPAPPGLGSMQRYFRCCRRPTGSSEQPSPRGAVCSTQAVASNGARQLWSRAPYWGSREPLTDVQPAQSKRSKREGGKTAGKKQELGCGHDLCSKLTATKSCDPWKALQIPLLSLAVGSGGGLPNQFSSWDDAGFFSTPSHAQYLLKAV